MLITKKSRTQFKFSSDFFRPDGHVILGDLQTARVFATRMSAGRADPLPATDLYAISLLDEAYHQLFKHFFNRYASVMDQAKGILRSTLAQKYEAALIKFTQEFPPEPVFLGELTADLFLSTNVPIGDPGIDQRTTSIQEMLLINNSNNNPALRAYKTLFDDSVLEDSAYKEFIHKLHGFLSAQPGIGSGGTSFSESLTDILAAPIRANPNSIEGQLRFIIEKWGHILGESFSMRILRGLDFMREEIIRQSRQEILKPESQIDRKSVV
jgi:hypothetical protein